MIEYNKTLRESAGAPSSTESVSSKRSKSSSSKTPVKKVGESSAGSGGAYKSKEFISDSSSGGEREL